MWNIKTGQTCNNYHVTSYYTVYNSKFPFSRGSSQPRSPTLQADSLLAEPQGKPRNTGVGSLSLLQQIFLTQESNKGLLHCRRILYQLSFQSGLMYVVSSGSEVNVNRASFLIFTSGRKRRLMFISDCSVVLLGQFEIWIFEAVEISS